MAQRSLRERLLSRLIITEAPTDQDRLGRPLIGPCLIWTGAKDRHGYGVIGVGSGPIQRVHRVVYELFADPTDLELDHLCRIPACSSPTHLEPVTHAENIRRGEWGRYVSDLRSMTHCKRDHEYNAENTLITSTGSRQCRICVRDLRRAAYDPAKERARKQRRKGITT